MGVTVPVSLCVCETVWEYIRDIIDTARNMQEVREMVEYDREGAKAACLELVRTPKWWKEYLLDSVKYEFDEDSACHRICARHGTEAFRYLIALLCSTDESPDFERIMGDGESDAFRWNLPSESQVKEMFVENSDHCEVGDDVYVVLDMICFHHEKIGVSGVYDVDAAKAAELAKPVPGHPRAALRMIVECAN